MNMTQQMNLIHNALFNNSSSDIIANFVLLLVSKSSVCSIIKLIIDRRKKDIVKFDVHIDSSGKTFHVDVKKMKKTDEIFVFTSLYNNKAKISII